MGFTLRNARRRRRFMDSSTKQKRRGPPFPNLAVDCYKLKPAGIFWTKSPEILNAANHSAGPLI
jgi:hypothetical protein